MEFGNLTGLWWGLLAIPIVIFYILKIRLRRQPVSTLLFWSRLYEEKRPRAIWQQLRHLISLLVQLAFLALLVSSLIDPFWSWERLQARRIVLVVDNSASMNATDVAPTRLAEAKKEAANWIRGLRLRDQMAIVSAGASPQVQVGLTQHQRTLRDALDAIPSTDGPTRVNEAIAIAQRLLAGRKNGKVVVLTDGGFQKKSKPTKPSNQKNEAENAGEESNDQPDSSEENRIETIFIGAETDNVAITQFQVRRSLVDPIGYQMLVEVTNFSDEPAQCRLEVTLGEFPVDVIPLNLAPEEVWRKAIDQTSAEGGQLVAQIDARDGLIADNKAVALLPERKKIPVTLVTDGSLFLQRVFEAIPLVELTMTDAIPEKAPSGGILVFHQKLPMTIPDGRVLIIDPPQSCDLFQVGDAIENPLVVEQNDDSPIMRHVRLENVLMPGAKNLEFTIEHETLAASLDTDPLIAAVNEPHVKALVMTVNLAEGDLPLRLAFPVLMTNAVNWFLGDQGELQQAVPTGSLLEVDLAPLLAQLQASGAKASAVNEVSKKSSPPTSGTDAEENLESVNSSTPASSSGVSDNLSLVLRVPDGQTRPLPTGVDKTTIGPLDQCGVWSILKQTKEEDSDNANEPEEQTENADKLNEPNLQFACNLSNSDESDLRTKPSDSSAAEVQLMGLGGRPIWFYLTLLALMLIAVEWYLYQRRWIS